MKRVLSLVLVLALVLGMVPAGFAADKTAGEQLKELKLVAGDSTGNLNEKSTITRAEMMVVLARLLGKYEEAAKYSIPSTSTDVKGHWAAPVIAFAEKESWTAGKAPGVFGPNDKVTVQQAAQFMLNALGYAKDFTFEKAVEEATKLGIMKGITTTSGDILRGDVFTAALNSLNTNPKGEKATLGVKLGVMKATTTVSALKLSKAAAVSHKTVALTLTDAVKAVDAKDISITDKDNKAVEIKSATLVSEKSVWVETADQTAGQLYTVKVGDVSIKYTAVQKDASTFKVDAANTKVVDNTTVKITFNKALDPRTALKAENYTIDNKLTVASVAFGTDKADDEDQSIVMITTSAQTANQIYKLTVTGNITDRAGNKVSSDSDANIVTFGGLKADTTAPKLGTITAITANKLTVTFTEDSDITAATATNVANYAIANTTDAAKTVTITSAKLVKDQTSLVKKVVELKTSAQVLSNKYELTVNNVADKFGNVITANSKGTFYGGAPDTKAPTIKSVEAKSNTVVRVTLDDSSDIDATTAEAVANYTFNKSLTVVKAAYNSTGKYVTLTTSAQKGGEVYEVTMANVKDELGNAVTTAKASFAGLALNESAPKVVSAFAKVETDGSTNVYVTYDISVNATDATTGSNYTFNNDLGAGISVEKKSDVQYAVKVNSLVENKLYTVTVANVKSVDDILIKDTNNTAQFVGVTTADTAAPEVTTAVAIDNQTLKIAFNKAMKVKTGGTTAAPVAQTGDIDFVSDYTIVNTTDSNAPVNFTAGSAKTIVNADSNEITIRFDEADRFVSGKLYKVTNTVAKAKNNGLVLNTSKQSATFGGISTAPTTPEVSAIYAINNRTVDVKFNIPVTFTNSGFAMTFTNTADATKNVVANASYTSVLSADKTVLRVSTAADLTAGGTYSINAKGFYGFVKDAFGHKSVANSDSTKSFVANSATNDLPTISSVANNTGSSVKVTMNEVVYINSDPTNNDSAITLSNFKISSGSAWIDAKHVETVNGKTADSEFIVYFDNTGMTVGSVQTLKIVANYLTDLVGAKNTADTTAKFAVSSSTRTEGKISDVVAVKTSAGYTKLRVVFNTPVNGLSTASFTVTSAGAENLAVAAIKTVDDETIAATDYVTVVDLTFAAGVNVSGKSVNVKFTAGSSVGKDGKAATTSDKTITAPTE